ncbi:5'-nucleotidase [Arenicella chitinivorans]|uniref:5'-nucleotidase n=1 Tax=Arenicella chitinivorans TaxID=1329800 RepID=A0A918RS55_9GAMM|nr:5'-nucleotidase [Arenicella chitinivorans]GHA10298.1 5'-nucleotidase [Arenicella chitinivorans]
MNDEQKLVVAISSRALFDLNEGHKIFEEEGVQAYCRYQIERENDLLEPGVAFPLVKKLLRLNELGEPRERVEVILLSRNSADTGLRIFNSIQEHNLPITRAAFTNGSSPFKYVEPFGADVFLSSDPNDVASTLEAGFAAATMLPSNTRKPGSDNDTLNIAFDGDAVVFSDEAEQIYKQKGLVEFSRHEVQSAKRPLPGGPFRNMLAALHSIQSEFSVDESPLRTALITARSAPAHERVIRTLRAWNIRIDEAVFLGGLPKGDFLRTFGADIFFDDQEGHCDSARQHVPTGHVPNGIANTKR